MPFALEQALGNGSQLVLAHVLSRLPQAVEPEMMYGNDAPTPLEMAEALLEPWCNLAREQQVECRFELAEGNPATEITRLAQATGADRLLLGSRAKGTLERLLLGSVTEEILRRVAIPVVTVGPETYPLPVWPTEPPLVLHASTLGPHAATSIAQSVQIASKLGARLALLHVVVHQRHAKCSETERAIAARQELERLAAVAVSSEPDAHAVDVSVHVAHGHPAIEILAATDALHASLLIVGAEAHGIFKDFGRERVLYRLLAHSRMPVFTLPGIETKTAPHWAEPLEAHS